MTGCIDRPSRGSRLTFAALAVAGLALFIALGGTSYAAGLLIGTEQIKPNAVTSAKIKNNRVSSADLRDNGVRSADLADGGVQLNDLTDRLQAMVIEGLSGLIDTGGLADGSVTNPKLATSSVSSSKVAPNALTSGDLGTASVRSSEIAGNGVAASEIATGAVAGAEVARNAIQGDEIENGSLNAADVGQVSGSADRNFPPIAPGSCEIVWIDPPGQDSFHNSAVLVTPSVGFGGNVSFHVEGGGSLRLKACNPGSAPIDPDGTGTTYNYIAFG